MLSSLLVVVIVGGAVALVTGWSLAGTKPATPAGESHGADGTDPAPADAPVSAAAPAPVVAPQADRGTGTPSLEDVRIPWWQRLRAALGLGLFVTLLGVALALAVAAAAFGLVAVLDRALG